MSELQIALIAIGAVIILAVLALNWWQERRFHRQVEKSFSPLQRDALLESQDHTQQEIDSQRFKNLDEPRFDVKDDYLSIDSNLDVRETQHFSINEELAIEPTALNFSPSLNNESSDRFVELPSEHATERVMQENESIEDTYNELVSAKNLKQEANENQEIPRQDADFKEVFDDILNEESQPEEQKSTSETHHIIEELSVHLPEMLHGQIDLTALLYLSTQRTVNSLNHAITGLFDNLDKPVFIHVLDSNKEWHLLKDMQVTEEALYRQVSKVACSLQMADRGGAVDRHVLNRFQLAVETLGLDINGHVEWQSAGDALSAAHSLDLFCIEVDKTIGFHLLQGESGAFTGTKLRGLAEAQGLILTSDGVFKYFDQTSDELTPNKQALVKPQLHPSFTMFNREDHPFSPEMLRSSVVKGITFQIDIPHVKHSTEMFNQMIQVARQMESSLNAVLVDDNNKVLGDIQIERIRQQLKVLQASMLTRGIVPGSDNAHRLFS